jgi:hypothetical protein
MLYAVEPLGVAMIRPSASATVTKLPSTYTSRCTDDGEAPLHDKQPTTMAKQQSQLQFQRIKEPPWAPVEGEKR